MTTGSPFPPFSDVDPFDLPDWVALGSVTWVTESGLDRGNLVRGRLVSEGEDDLACDVVAIDDAYPAPIADPDTRARAHQAWHHGQVHLAEREERLVLTIPGRLVDLQRALEAMRRLSLAVGGSAERFAVLLRLGDRP